MLEEARKDLPPEALEGACLYQHLDLSLPASRIMKEKILLF